MGTRIETLGQLAEAIRSDPALAARVREDPANAIAGLASPLRSDVWIYRIVVSGLALAVLGTLAGSVLLALQARAVPDVLLAIGSGAVGALAGLLAPAPASRGG